MEEQEREDKVRDVQRSDVSLRVLTEFYTSTLLSGSFRAGR